MAKGNTVNVERFVGLNFHAIHGFQEYQEICHESLFIYTGFV